METKLDKGYTDNLPLWAQVRAAIRGKQGAIKLLDSSHGYFGIISPHYRITQSNQAEVNQKRLAYFGRGRFFEATGRTHDAYVGMIGSRDVEFETKNEKLIELSQNVDGGNSTLNDFALEIASELLITARYGVLVDPPSNEGKTISQMDSSKLVGYMAESIVRHVEQSGKLVMVELLETYWKKVDDDYECKEQTRRLEIVDGKYTSRIKREDDWEEPVIPKIKGNTLDYIPFQFFGSENNKPSYDRPVMFGLAHQNMGHFMLDCDNRDNLHWHGQGMVNISTEYDSNEEIEEMNPGGIGTGAKEVNFWKQGDKVEILQIEATGAIPSEMLRDEKRLIMLGAQVTQDSATNQTLGAKEIESSASTSQLRRISNNTTAGLNQCFIWASDFMSIDYDATLKVNNQFVTDDMTAQDVQSVFQAVQGGSLPQSVLLNTARKAGYTDKTNEELIEELEDSGIEGSTEREAELQMEIDNLREQLANQGGE